MNIFEIIAKVNILFALLRYAILYLCLRSKATKRKRQSKYPKTVNKMKTAILSGAELKQKLCYQLAEMKPTENAALTVGLALDISFRTVQRYCSGDIKEVRRIDLAQDILKELHRATA